MAALGSNFIHIHAVFGKNLAKNRFLPQTQQVSTVWEILDPPLYYSCIIKANYCFCVRTYPENTQTPVLVHVSANCHCAKMTSGAMFPSGCKHLSKGIYIYISKYQGVTQFTLVAH